MHMTRALCDNSKSRLAGFRAGPDLPRVGLGDSELILEEVVWEVCEVWEVVLGVVEVRMWDGDWSSMAEEGEKRSKMGQY